MIILILLMTKKKHKEVTCSSIHNEGQKSALAQGICPKVSALQYLLHPSHTAMLDWHSVANVFALQFPQTLPSPTFLTWLLVITTVLCKHQKSTAFPIHV
jgi:hypothetical protein